MSKNLVMKSRIRKIKQVPRKTCGSCSHEKNFEDYGDEESHDEEKKIEISEREFDMTVDEVLKRNYQEADTLTIERREYQDLMYVKGRDKKYDGKRLVYYKQGKSIGYNVVDKEEAGFNNGGK